MPSCPHGLFIFSLVLGAQVFLSYGLTSIHLTFRIRRKTKQRCIGLNSFPSRKLNTISLPIGLSFNVRRICVEHLYPPFRRKTPEAIFLLNPFSFIMKRIDLSSKRCCSPPSGNRYPNFGVTESRSERSMMSRIFYQSIK